MKGSHPLMLLSIFSVIGAGLMTLGAVLASREHAWLRKAQSGPGAVVELVTKSEPKGATVRTRRVRFTAHDGSIHDFVRSFGFNPTALAVGQDVEVAYDPQTYEGRILTFGQRFGLAAVVFIMGFSLILIKVTFTYGNRLLPRIYGAQTTDGPSARIR